MEKTTSIKAVADRVMRHPMMRDMNFEEIVDYVIDFFGIMGCPALFEEKVVTLAVKEHKALLPCDFVEIIQLRTKKDEHGPEEYFTYATDSFHMSAHKDDKDRPWPIRRELTYKIQGGALFTSIECGEVEMAYRAIACDDEDYPLIPDSPVYMRAIVAYIKRQHFGIMFDLGQINAGQLSQAQQDYAWAAGALETDSARLSLDKAQSLFNTWRDVLVDSHAHRTGFRYNR